VIAMKKLLSRCIISSVVILALVIIGVNQQFITSANTIIQNSTPLTLSQLEELINVPTPDHAVALIIQQRKIAFTPTEKILVRLKNLGAGTETIKELRKYLKLSPSASRPYPSPITSPTRPSNPNKITILVAKFRGPDPEKYLVTDKILQELVTATEPYPDVSIQPLEETITEQTGDRGGSKYARAVGAKRNASIVLWGYYGVTPTNVDIYVYFEVLRKPETLALRSKDEEYNLLVGELDGFKIQGRISGEMSYLTLLTIGLARLESGDYSGAIARFTKALEQSYVPEKMIDRADVYYYRGLAYYLKAGTGGIDQAIADFDHVIQINPASAKAYYYRGFFYLKKAMYDRAIANFDEALQRKTDFAEAFNNRGAAYSKTGQQDRAIADFNEAIKLQHSFIAYNNRGNYYSGLGRYDAALNDYKESIRLQPDYALAYNNLALLYSKTGKNSLVISAFNKAIRLKADYAEAYYNRGIFYGSMGQYDLAIRDYLNAIKNNLDLSDVYYNLGVAYDGTGEYSLAIATYMEAIKRKPDDAEAYNNLGRAYDKLGKYEDALAAYNKAIKHDPNLAEAYNNRGFLYGEVGEYSLAIADLNEAIKRKRDYARAYVNLGFVYTEMGKYDLAIAGFDKAIESQRDYAEAYNDRGVLHFQMGRPDLALVDYNHAINFKPKFDKPYFNRALYYLKKGERGSAVSDFKHVLLLTTDPKLRQSAEDGLQQLGVK
jgi:tetratricopeptide (TPR) repeat protein